MTIASQSSSSSRAAPEDPASDVLRAAADAELAALLERAAAGSTSAFEAFYDQTLPRAHALARRMLRASDLEDVLSDAYFQAWREVRRFDARRGSAITWLLTRVRSRALDHLRRARAVGANQGNTNGETGDAPSGEPGPPDLLAATEAAGRVHCALEQLGNHERWVLGLAYYRDLSHSQIANETGLPLGTVKSLILRAQARLRRILISV